MNKSKFKVIKGGGNKTPIPKYIFKKGFVTNTRLMGVVGMKLYWETEKGEEYVQFFHMDFEEYGIDGFESLVNASVQDIDTVTAKMMGGLGGQLIEITEQEGIYLLQETYQVNINYDQSLPGYREEYDFLLKVNLDLSKSEKKIIWKKICEEITREVQLVNYYLMRSVGVDNPGKSFLACNDKPEDFQPTTKPSTLIKNVVEYSGSEDGIKYYNCESVIDLENGYQLIMSEIGIIESEDGPRVAKAEVKNKMKISTVEAAFQLKKPEYILIYSLEDFIEVVELMDEMKPNAMQNIHEAGFLYTEFNPTNEHVKDNVYYLNGDIYAVYFITTDNQLAVSTFSEETLKNIKKFFKHMHFKEIVEFESEFKTDTPLLYEFVQSGLGDFYEFINKE